MAMSKDFVTVRVDADIYEDVKAAANATKPAPTITHLVNVLLNEALDARKAGATQ